ncbi:MAG: FKBP-type peptidyl-prolyl cis-trans isomerase [Chloroflexi bacterium]|nr:MAG: FKBP-type peptidyl-prolyl cis-trans isomerase [Chloroflexota bacterium]
MITAGAGLVFLLFVTLVAFLLWNRQNDARVAAEATTTAQAQFGTTQTAQVALATPFGAESDAEVVTTASGLQYQDLVIGEGDAAQAGDTVSVHYTGWLVDGTEFDTSRDSGQPFEFTIGQGSVISGWDEGVAGMMVGGVRKLYIPSELGYGAGGSPPVIPGNATLVFEVELLAVQ